MVRIKLKRVYDEMDVSDGLRVFVDRLWPREPLSNRSVYIRS